MTVRKLSWRGHQDCLNLKHDFYQLHPYKIAQKWGWTSPSLEVLMRDEAPRAVTAICRALEEQIEHGLLPSGSQLPAERKLSEVFDTTRITLREALSQLEAQGLIYREERRGLFHRHAWPTTRWCAATSMRWCASRGDSRPPSCSALG